MKTIFLLLTCGAAFCKFSTGQILCVQCYDQNDSISIGVNNLLLNGSFENGCALNGFFCPSSSSYACDITDWICTGGGTSTYANVYDGSATVVPNGILAAYFGNAFCQACSPIVNDTSCLNNVDCTVASLPAGYPLNSPIYGGATGISLQQTVSGLTPGNTYVLEFWAGGESFGYFLNKGLFGIDVGFGDTLLRCKPTPPGGTGSVYIVEFTATASSHTIKFTNWGHICNNCTELILDNVRLYTLAELSPLVTSCTSSSSSNSFAASDTALCEKFCIDFFDSSTNNPTAWQWLFPGGSPSSSTVQNPTFICYQTPGIYDVTLITTSASGNDTLTMPNYITVYPTPPFPTITQVGYTLTSSPANFYQWQFNSYNIAGATNQSYSVMQSGLYTIVVSDSNGCVNSSNKYVLISGIAEEGDANISISPNPSSGDFTVELLNGFAGDKLSIDVVNTLGQKIFSSEEYPFTNATSFKKEIDLAPFADGVYYLTLHSENVSTKKKIVITH